MNRWSHWKRRLAASRNVLQAATYDRLGTVPPSPLMVYVELTRRCNMKCRHCDIWMTGRNQADLAAREVPGKRLVETLVDLAPDGLLAVDLFGGEPLLREDVAEVVAGLKEAGLHVTITTNGTLLNHSMSQALVAAGLDQLLVSLDGPDEATHDGIRGRAGTFSKVVRGLRTFHEAAANRAVRTGINTLVCRPNIHLLEQMPELAVRLGVDQLRLLPYHQCYPFNQYTQDDELVPRTADLPALQYALRRVEEGAREAGLATNSATYLKGITRWYQGKRIEVRCQAGLSVCDINGFGDLFPCYTLATPVGNVKETSLRELWRSEAMEKHRRHSAACTACWQSCYVEPGLRLSLSALLEDRRAVLHDLMEYILP